MTRLLALLALMAASSCDDADRSREVLRKSGYRDIQTTGWKFGECSDSDTYSTGFKATNANGERVEGTVCCGLALKGCTVRF